MNVHLKKSSLKPQEKSIQITGSKSESNRLLILQALFEGIIIQNLSNANDTQVLQKALQSSDAIIDVHHAGTAMRFLTAYYATQQNRVVTLTGSKRMQERPIGVLVTALRTLGADISYLKKEGYPPLQIKGKALHKSEVDIAANVSSQFISALLLIAPSLQAGLKINLIGEITSIPYIKMTLALLSKIGVKSEFKNNTIKVVSQTRCVNEDLIVESDWSSASYFYSLVALSKIGTEIKLSSYFQESLQGDSVLKDIYQKFGVTTIFEEDSVVLKKINDCEIVNISCELNNAPDIAQTIVVTCFGLGISCNLTGLHTLKIKETDRLVALQNELEKLGALIHVTDDALYLTSATKIKKNVSIVTYQDHRMAMSFAPLALKTNICIEDAEVVSKSYPYFWEDLKAIGIQIK